MLTLQSGWFVWPGERPWTGLTILSTPHNGTLPSRRGEASSCWSNWGQLELTLLWQVPGPVCCCTQQRNGRHTPFPQPAVSPQPICHPSTHRSPSHRTPTQACLHTHTALLHLPCPCHQGDVNHQRGDNWALRKYLLCSEDPNNLTGE